MVNMLSLNRIVFSKEWRSSACTTAITRMMCIIATRHDLLADQHVSWVMTFKERSIHSSAFLSGGNKLMKMLTNKKKKHWYNTPQQTTPLGLPDFLRPSKKKTQEDSVRVRTLNNIIYKAVTDLLNSYEVNTEVTAYNVQISKVSLPPDFSSCRIYWKTSLSAEQDSQIQQALDKCAPRIRYLLISHQILGGVPPLVFIRDKQYAAMMEIENLLKTAVFGSSEEETNQISNDVGATLNPMDSGEKKRPVLFGVDHDALHKQIEAYKREKGSRETLAYKREKGSRETLPQSPELGGLTQEQLDTLAEIRKQKLVEKKKLKSKRMKDDDITPKDYLLARSLQKEEKEEQDNNEDTLLDSQITQLMTEDNRRH